MIQRVFLDMDGVIADFISPAMAFHGAKFDAATYPPREWNTWKVIGCTEQEFWKFDSYEFWRDLPEYPWAEELIEGLQQRVGQKYICLLTSPSQHPDCIRGKRDWIATHFPTFFNQVLFGGCKHFCANPSTILIDDSDSNCQKFMEAGGHVVTFPRVWNTFGERDDPAAYTLRQLDTMIVRAAA